jgi:arylesterase/paraoxonase
MRILTPVVVLLAVAALFAAAGIGWAGFTFKQFDEIVPVEGPSCTPVVGIAGAGDIEPFPGTASAFLSAYDRRGGAARGQIILFDTDNPLDADSWRDRTGGVPAAFIPSGIDLYETVLAEGRMLRRLFVVNLAGPEIVLFDVAENGSLAVVERFSDPRLVSPNDVVALGPRSFYASNDTAAGRKTLRGKLDFLLGLRTGSIYHYDGNSWSESIGGLAFPNGLALSPARDALYVAEMRTRSLLEFARDPLTDTLRKKRTLPLSSFPNNLSVGEDGAVLIGSLPQPLATSAYGEGLQEIAASEVLRVLPDGGGIETVLREDGSTLSAVSVAVQAGERILVGSRAADRFLMCETER